MSRGRSDGGGRGRRSELGTRLAVAALGIPLAVAVTWLGGAWFAAGLGVLAAVATGEIGRMLEGRGAPFLSGPGIAGALLLPPVVFAAGDEAAWPVLVLWTLAALGWTTLRRDPEQRPFTAAALTAAAVLYTGGLLAFGVGLRTATGDRAGGTLLFFLPVALTWAADTAAYFGGRAFGRRRLAPRISPNKTVAGGVAAVLAGPAAALLYLPVLLPDLWTALGPVRAIGLGLLVSGAAILGDLCESALKRECGVKDASSLIPGHGGLLDRLDSLLWSLPAAHLYLRALGLL